MARYTAGSVPNTPYNTTGKVTTPFGTSSDTETGYAVAIQSDGKIVAGGYAHIAADGHNEFAKGRDPATFEFPLKSLNFLTCRRPQCDEQETNDQH